MNGLCEPDERAGTGPDGSAPAHARGGERMPEGREMMDA